MENIFSVNKKKQDPAPDIKVEPVVEQAPVKSEQQQPTVQPPAGANNGHYGAVNIIDLVNIRQEYDNGKTVVFDNLNLSIPDVVGKGQFITLLGQSGCGKSTILNYLSNLAEPTSGSIFVRGKLQDENSSIPMVFQQYSSFYWMTVLDNIAFPLILAGVDRKEARERAKHMIDVVGLNGHENKWAKYPTLSGGQLQRVAIARGLMANPKMLLMDEPFGALDPVIRNQMQDMLRKIFEDDNELDPTIIQVTHDIREAVYLSTDIFVLGGKPASVKQHFEIDLPDHRDQKLKRTPKFFDYVDQIDEIMNNIK
jgi:NitT/TauT family transport system ATP-binding protein